MTGVTWTVKSLFELVFSPLNWAHIVAPKPAPDHFDADH